MLEKLKRLRALLKLRAWFSDPTLQGSSAVVILGQLQTWLATDGATVLNPVTLGKVSTLVGASLIIARALTKKPLEEKAAPAAPAGPDSGPRA